MGTSYVPGAYSGRTYELRYDGDTPTATETARGQAFVESQEAQFRADYEAKYGVEDYDDGTAFGRAWDRGKTGAYNRMGTLLRSTGEQAGFDWLDNMGTGMESRAREEQLMEAGRLTPATSRQDVDGISSALTYAGELAGGSAVDTLAGIAGTVGGGIAGGIASGGNPLGALAGGIAGGTAMVSPLFAGSNIQRQEEVLGRSLEPGEYGKALATAVAQGALNSVADRVLLGLQRSGVPLPSAKNLFVRTGQYGARGIAAEVPTEVGQQLLERAQAGLPIGDDEAIAEYVDAAVGAAVLGGLGGAVQGPFRGPKEDVPEPDDTPADDTPADDTPALATPPGGTGARAAALNAGLGTPATGPRAGRGFAWPAPPTTPTTPPGGAGGGTGGRAAALNAGLGAPATGDRAGSGFSFPGSNARSLRAEYDTIAAALATRKNKGVTIPVLKEIFKEAGMTNKGAQSLIRRLAREKLLPDYVPGRSRTLNPFPGAAAPEVAPTAEPKPEVVPEPDVADGDITTTMGTEEATEADPEVVPEVAPEPEVVPEAAAEPEVVPEVAPEPEVVPEATAEPEVVPEVAPDAEAAPEVTPEVAPEVEADTDPGGLEGNQGQDNGRARPMGRNDSPGVVGRGGAAEPRGIPGVPYEPRTAPPATGDARRAEALRKVLARNLTDRHAKRSANWSPEARSKYEESVGEARLDMEDRRGSEPLTSGDYETITALVNSKGTSDARNFFKLFPDPLDGLEMIASNWDTTFSAKAGPMYEGLSSPKARKAAAWVNDNLSAGANNFLNGRLEFYGDTTSREEIDAAGIPARIKVLEEAKQFAEPAELSALDAEIDGLQKQLNQRKYAADRKGVDDTAEQIAKDKAKYGRKSAYVSLRSPLHPFVRAHLRAGNLNGALEAMGNTARSPRMRKLANRLATYTGSTSVALVEDTDPRLRRGLTNKYAYGAFIPSENAILIAKRATAYESVLLHEAVHMATEAELNNEASPVRRRLANIMQKTAEIHGEEDIPGSLTDVNEFVAEFMSNGEFQEVMDQMQSRGDEVSLFTRTKRVLENFIRRLMGMQPRKYATPETGVEPTDDIRTLVDGVLSAAPVGGELNTATPRFFEMSTPEGARRMLKSMHEAAPEGAQNLYNDAKLAMAQTELPGRVGNIWRGLLVPMKNLTVYAKPIIPMAGAAWDVVTGHHATLSQRNDVLRRMTTDVMTLLKSDIDVVKEFNQLATRASLLGIDPQISVADARNMFDKFSFKYKTDTAGVRSDWKYEYFDGPAERDARKDAYNAALPADGLKSLRARKGRDASPSDMAEFTALKRMYDALTPDAKAAYKKTLAYYAYLHEETRRVMKARIESMSKGNVALHRALYDDMYDRIFNAQSITAYVPLMREGNYWITFSARDPQSGNIELYKTSYKSDMERQTAIKELEAHRAANPGDGITPDISTIEEYTTTRADPRTNGTVPLSFMQDMRDVLKKDMDAAVAADPTKADDAETRRATLEKELVALALELTPERSFLQAYKAREGVRGAIGDRGPLEERNLSARDTVDRMLRKGGLLSRQLANVEYRSRAQEVAEEMREYINAQKALGGADKVPLKKTEKMDAYYDAIVPSLENISIERASWSRGANTAAYAWTLSLNPSSAFMNLTSIPVFVMPYLGARHGYSRSYKALNHAMKVLGASGRKRMVDYIKDDGTIGQRPDDVKLGGNSIANYTLGAFDESSNYAAGDNRLNNLGPLVQALRTAGMLDDSLAYDITEANDISHAGRLQRASRVGAWMMHTTENISRELTAITAYNLILQDMAGGKRARADGTSSISDKLTPADLEAAANQAAEDTELTNGTIPAAGAPRLGVGNVASPLYMFKRHPLAMLNLIATTFKDSFLSKERLAELAETYGVDSAEYKNEAEVQRTAKLQFVSILGHLGLVSGVAGIPLISGIAAIASAIFLDDDDPTFMEMFRMSNPLGELGYYGLGNYITGGAMSGRIGLGGAIYQPPLGVEDQSPFWTAMEGLAGPVVGLPIGIQRRAARLFERGEPWRAWEAIAPSVVRNQMRAYRYAKAGGAESTRGDMIAEFGIGRSILQGLGLSPADFIQKTEANSTGKRIEQSIIAARTEILRQGNVARRTGNAAEAANLRQARREFNAEYPEYKITADTLGSSWDNFKRTSKQMVNGVQFNPKLRGRIDDLTASLRDNPATLWDALGVG